MVQGRRMQRKERQETVVQLDSCVDLGRVLAPIWREHCFASILRFSMFVCRLAVCGGRWNMDICDIHRTNICVMLRIFLFFIYHSRFATGVQSSDNWQCYIWSNSIWIEKGALRGAVLNAEQVLLCVLVLRWQGFLFLQEKIWQTRGENNTFSCTIYQANFRKT